MLAVSILDLDQPEIAVEAAFASDYGLDIRRITRLFGMGTMEAAYAVIFLCQRLRGG